MPTKKSVIIHPRPNQVRLTNDGKWIALSRSPGDGAISNILPTWSYIVCSRIGDTVVTDTTGDGAGLEAILLMLRASDASTIFLTEEDWKVLTPELAKPIVPTCSLTVTCSDTPTFGITC